MDWEKIHVNEQADGYADYIMLTLYPLDRMKVIPVLIMSNQTDMLIILCVRSVHFDCIK
jgi:hypothetical protein